MPNADKYLGYILWDPSNIHASWGGRLRRILPAVALRGLDSKNKRFRAGAVYWCWANRSWLRHTLTPAREKHLSATLSAITIKKPDPVWLRQWMRGEIKKNTGSHGLSVYIWDELSPMEKVYGEKAVLGELVRQVQQLSHADQYLGEILRSSLHINYGFVRDLAIHGLDSKNFRWQTAAVLWCHENKKLLTPAQLKHAHDLSHKIFKKWIHDVLKAEPSDHIPDGSAAVKVYGYGVVMREEVRQAKLMPHPDAYLGLILDDAYDVRADFMHDLMIRGLDSKDKRYRVAAVSWCRTNKDLVTAAELKHAHAVARRIVVDSGGDEGFYDFAHLATPADVPLIRRVYQKRFHDQLAAKAEGHASDDFYSCRHAFGLSSTTRANFVLLLARLGDRTARMEIAKAIKQSDNVQRRMWGLLMLAHLKDKKMLPLVWPCLDDTRHSMDFIDEYQNPKTDARRFRRVVLTRVCDMAVRVIAELAPPKKPWPFKVPSAKGWSFTEGISTVAFPSTWDIDRGWNPKGTLVIQHMIAGFTKSQIEQVKRSRGQFPGPSHLNLP